MFICPNLNIYGKIIDFFSLLCYTISVYRIFIIVYY